MPPVFKGIALFTPGGDLVYCIDPEKRQQWHLDLCTALQEKLRLKSPPYFLLPCYTATVDRWLDANTGELHTVAEAYPRAIRFQGLLNAVFGLNAVRWQPNRTVVQHCLPSALDANRSQFPQLWENHDLVLPITRTVAAAPVDTTSFRFQLFVRSQEHIAAEKILMALRHTLEQSLSAPYTLQLVDVAKHPDQAEQANITATPALVRAWPLPVRRLVGDLSSPERIAQLLE
ncbi:circadian clock protein KaiB [filamentous cyanobacterium CCP5]|nr:circadian clock protein KaiB [filamentous cyanobacterium CCP5]